MSAAPTEIATRIWQLLFWLAAAEAKTQLMTCIFPCICTREKQHLGHTTLDFTRALLAQSSASLPQLPQRFVNFKNRTSVLYYFCLLSSFYAAYVFPLTHHFSLVPPRPCQRRFAAAVLISPGHAAQSHTAQRYPRLLAPHRRRRRHQVGHPSLRHFCNERTDDQSRS